MPHNPKDGWSPCWGLRGRCSLPGFSPIWTAQGEHRHTLHQQGPSRDPCGTRYMLYNTSCERREGEGLG
ncbi:unnamed protein product [Arctogadus glacialis]